ncbi:MAG: hypothetical protein IJ783_00750, partial [Kiritimatiellae bacterium]|nr:hypothetical protein [Kiritimatiellia bacterium]
GPKLHAAATGGAGAATVLRGAAEVWLEAGSAPGRYSVLAARPGEPEAADRAEFAVGRVAVESLRFNWDAASSARDAMNMRWDRENAIDSGAGEWTRAGARAPALYATNAHPVVLAELSVEPADIAAVELFAETGAAIGGFAAADVAFADGAARGVELATASGTAGCISKETFDLDWKAVVRDEDGTAATNALCTTGGHVFYTILGEPVEPWSNAHGDPANAWASALDVVCSNGWAKGATTVAALCAMVTTAINESNRFAYDTTDGDVNYTDATGFMHFSSALDRICGNAGRGELVNCLDCANLVTVFSNLAGAQLWTSFMGGSGFLTNPYTAIGRPQWAPPSWGPAFSYHAVSWTGDCGDGDSVFDACLRYDGDGDPTSDPKREELPAGIQFSDGSPSAPYVYRERLARPGPVGYGACISRPFDKMRPRIQ